MDGEALLFESLQRREPAAARAVFKKYASWMMMQCVCTLRHHPAALGAFLHGFGRFYLHADKMRYQGPGTIQACLHTAMKHQCMDAYRKFPERLPYDPEDEDGARLPADDIGFRFYTADVRSLIDRLPEDYRKALMLYADGHTADEVEAMMGEDWGLRSFELRKALYMICILVERGPCRMAPPEDVDHEWRIRDRIDKQEDGWASV